MLSSRIGLVPVARDLPRQQALELAVGPLAARHQAGGAVGQPLRGAHVGDRSPSAAFTAAITAASSTAAEAGFGLVRRLLEQRHQAEIDLALAQRLERLALEIGLAPWSRTQSTGSVSSSTSMPRARAASSFGLDLRRSRLSPAR